MAPNTSSAAEQSTAEALSQDVLHVHGTIYEQVKDTPMCSPNSGFIAEAVLQRLMSLVFQRHRPKFWVRYVDDTFVVIERDQVLTFQEHLNAVFPDIQFTMEEEENNQLAFLDVLVCRKDCGGLKTKVFRKATNTMQVLNFNSNHPISHKSSCVRTLYRRVETHCSEPEDKIAKLQHLRRVFKANGYPRNFVNRADQDSAIRYAYQRDVKACMIARLLILYVLRRHFLLDPVDVRVERSPEGRPHLPSQPAFGTSANKFLLKMKSIFAASEWNFLMSGATDAAKMQRFFRLWCLKEAYVKALGVGLGMDLQTVEFQLSNSTPTCVCAEPALWTFEEHALDPSHAVAIAWNISDPQRPEPGEFKTLSFEELVADLRPFNEVSPAVWSEFLAKDSSPPSSRRTLS
ncbi:hypothetical protein SprV_0200609400 [Sparganum proliferum]